MPESQEIWIRCHGELRTTVPRRPLLNGSRIETQILRRNLRLAYGIRIHQENGQQEGKRPKPACVAGNHGIPFQDEQKNIVTWLLVSRNSGSCRREGRITEATFNQKHIVGLESLIVWLRPHTSRAK
jgi:hypothetical protein